MFDIYTIIFLALAVFIFLRLRSVLGQRTGRERPPISPRTSTNDNVVNLPNRTGESAKPVETAPTAADAAAAVPPQSPAAAGLAAIVARDTTFDAERFVAGGRAAYEMIVVAFASGDRRTLKTLLSREVYEGFDAVISDRESRGETAETRFVSIDRADITAAEVRGATAQITMRFVSKLVSSTKNQSGTVIEGSPEKVTDVTDVWTFARDISSRDPNWKLVATEAGH